MQLRWKRDEDRKQKEQTQSGPLKSQHVITAAAGLSCMLEMIAVVTSSAVNICHPNRLVTTSDSRLITGTHAAPPQP